MISQVDLRLRISPLDDHRVIGLTTVEHRGLLPAPHQEIACWAGGRRITARVTSVHHSGGHLPRVYADAIPADELVH